MINIISLGANANASLSEDAVSALASAKLIIGAVRQLKTIDHLNLDLNNSRLIELPSPLKKLAGLIQESGADIDTDNISILASGDALFYGIGKWINKTFPDTEKTFHPNTSSMQTLYHKLGLDWQDIITVSLHGRAIETLNPRLCNNRYFSIFTDAKSHPQAIAQQVIAAGFDQSTLWIAEDLGYPEESITEYSAKDLAQKTLNVADLHITLIKTKKNQQTLTANICPEFPGIEDHVYLTDGNSGQGLITKKEIRLAILNLLQPGAGDIGWDIGAGCGGVTVEWAKWNRFGAVHAVEKHPQRFDILNANLKRFGVTANTHTTHGSALDILNSLPDPTTVFIGGSGGDLPTLLDECWKRLKSGGCLVASAVTENTKLALLQFSTKLTSEDTEWVELSISKGSKLAGQLLMRPNLPVTLMKLTKNTKHISSVTPESKTKQPGTLQGVGVGPGDPDLLTLRAHRLILSADVLCYLTNDKGNSLAKDIAIDAVKQNTNALHIPINVKMQRDRIQANQAYDEAAIAIAAQLTAGKNVSFLCEGDPLFYGSFNYLLERLSKDFACAIVPGISSIHCSSAAAKIPLTLLSQNLAVLNGRCSDKQLSSALTSFDNLIIMKAGVSRERLLSLIESAGRKEDAIYLENISRSNEIIEHDISHLAVEEGPYFSLFFISANKNREVINNDN